MLGLAWVAKQTPYLKETQNVPYTLSCAWDHSKLISLFLCWCQRDGKKASASRIEVSLHGCYHFDLEPWITATHELQAHGIIAWKNEYIMDRCEVTRANQAHVSEPWLWKKKKAQKTTDEHTETSAHLFVVFFFSAVFTIVINQLAWFNTAVN